MPPPCEPGQDSGRVVGGLYSANTLGAIAGSLLASLVIVMWLGSQRAQQVLMVVAAVSGLIVLAPPLLAWAVKRTGSTWLAAAIPLMLIAGATAVLVRTVPPLPGLLVAYGRKMPTMLSGPPEILYVGEGLNSSVAVSEFPGGVTSYHNAGKIQASSLPQDMRLQRMLGHLTTLAPRQATSVLVIGCGAGVTAGAVSVDPDRREAHHRRDRAARATRRVDVLRRVQPPRRHAIRKPRSSSTTRGTSC